MSKPAAIAVKERPIIFDGESVRAILGGHKSQTRRVVGPGNSSFGSAHREYWKHCDLASAWRDGIGSGSEYLHVPGAHDAVACEVCALYGWGTGESVHRLYPHYSDSGSFFEGPARPPRSELWVRETFQFEDCSEYGFELADAPEGPSRIEDGIALIPRYRATAPDTVLEVVPNDTGDPDRGMRWRSPIHMPRWASRLTLRVTDVRVERLQEITEADAIAEGVDHMPSTPASMTHRGAFSKRWEAINAKRGHPWASNPWVWAVTFERVEANA